MAVTGWTGTIIVPATISGDTKDVEADFGAVGDGVTNDRVAIQAAFTYMNTHPGTLTFGAGKTYSVGLAAGTMLMTLTNADGVKLDGQGATIKAHANTAVVNDNYIIRLQNCTNMVIDTLHIDGNRVNRGDPTADPDQLDDWQIRGGSNISFLECIAKNACRDGFSLIGKDGYTSNALASRPTNILFYKCTADFCWRNGFMLSSGNNIQILGGFAINMEGAKPQAPVDIESEASGLAANNDNILVRGLTCSNNKGRFNITARLGPAKNITVEGCRFNLNRASPDLTVTASALNQGGNDNILIQNNTFEGDGGIQYNQIAHVLNNQQGFVSQSNVLIDNNSFNNLDAKNAQLFINAQSTPGPGTVSNNVFFSSPDVNVQISSAGWTDGGGNTTSGVRTDPAGAETPPWDVTFETVNTTIPEFVAKLGEVVSASTAAQTLSTSVAVTVQNFTSNMLIAVLNPRETGGTTKEVSSVVLGSQDFIFVGEENISPGNNRKISFWKFANPTPGPGTVTATYSGAMDATRLTVYQYKNVGSVVFYGVGSQAASTVASMDTTTTLVNSLILTSANFINGTTAPFAPTGGTERTDGATGANTSNDMGYTDIETTAADIDTYTVSTESGTSANHGIASIIIQPISEVNVFKDITGFERLREFGNTATTITNPPVAAVITSGFDRTREFGTVTTSIPNPITVVVDVNDSTILVNPFQYQNGLLSILQLLRDNDILLQDGVFDSLGVTDTPDFIDRIPDEELTYSLQYTGGFVDILRRLHSNDLVLNEAIGIDAGLTMLSDEILSNPNKYINGLLFIILTLQTNDDLLADAIPLMVI